MSTHESEVDLGQFDDDFAHAPLEEREFAEVPDGKYQVVVERAELVNAKSTGRPMLKWTLRILGPAYEGRMLWRNHVMSSKESIGWLKNDLHLCGLDLVRITDLHANLERLLDVVLEISVRTRGDNRNIYFNRRLESAASEGSARLPTNVRSHEDVPF